MSAYVSCCCGDLKDSGMARFYMFFGALLGFAAVALSAVAAHALPSRLDAKALTAVQSAIQMQGWHALVLLFCAVWMLRAPPASLVWANVAGAAFSLGVVLFSGSIYAGELGGVRIGPTAPTGGILLMAGWLLLAVSALRAGPTP
jgi:uncharacterized membrane protein YgdD (TMEM256/DUF423 family)